MAFEKSRTNTECVQFPCGASDLLQLCRAAFLWLAPMLFVNVQEDTGGEKHSPVKETQIYNNHRGATIEDVHPLAGGQFYYL